MEDSGEGKPTVMPGNAGSAKDVPDNTMNALYRQVNGAGSLDDLRAFILHEQQVMRSLNPESARYKEHKPYLDQALLQEEKTMDKIRHFLADPKPAPTAEVAEVKAPPAISLPVADKSPPQR